jgi:hypothetical protein
MPRTLLTRRTLLTAAGVTAAAGVSGLLMPAQAKGLPPTPTMRGGANNYLNAHAPDSHATEPAGILSGILMSDFIH